MTEILFFLFCKEQVQGTVFEEFFIASFEQLKILIKFPVFTDNN